jgi:hypothetical protein
MMDSRSLLISKSCSSPDDGQYVPSTVKVIELPISMICGRHGELYDLDLRRHVLAIIRRA